MKSKPTPLTLIQRKQIEFLLEDPKNSYFRISKTIGKDMKTVKLELAKWKLAFEDKKYDADKAHEVLPKVHLSREEGRKFGSIKNKKQKPPSLEEKILVFYKRGYKAHTIARLLKIGHERVERILKRANIKAIEKIDPEEAKQWITK